MKFFDRQLVLVPKSRHRGTLHSKYNEAIGEALKIYLAGKSRAEIENMDETEAKKMLRRSDRNRTSAGQCRSKRVSKEHRKI